jgi:hypothetical protein
MATEIDRTISRDSDYGFAITFKDAENNPVTGVVFSCAIRLKYKTPVVTTFEVAEDNPGVYTFYLARAKTRLLAPNLSYTYDVAYKREGAVTRPIYGNLIVVGDISPID